MNRKNKEGEFYTSKVRQFLGEYGGVNLEDFCKAERVSYSKMCNCLGRPSYRKPSLASRSQVGKHIYGMLKSEEHTQEILVSQLNTEKRARRAAEKKAHDAELRISSLLDKVNELQSGLDKQLDKVSELVSQVTALFMGDGPISLSESVKESLVGAIREEFEMQKRELMASFDKERQDMLDAFALKLAAKDNEIAMLRGRDNGDGHQSPTTSSP